MLADQVKVQDKWPRPAGWFRERQLTNLPAFVSASNWEKEVLPGIER